LETPALGQVPQLHLFYGMLAPNARLRAEIIPQNKKNKPIRSDASDDVPHSSASVRTSWARLLN